MAKLKCVVDCQCQYILICIIREKIKLGTTVKTNPRDDTAVVHTLFMNILHSLGYVHKLKLQVMDTIILLVGCIKQLGVKILLLCSYLPLFTTLTNFLTATGKYQNYTVWFLSPFSNLKTFQFQQMSRLYCHVLLHFFLTIKLVWT